MKDSICWDCKWSTGLGGVCSWVSDFTEVEGWKALRRDLIYGTKTDISYCVIECPLFTASIRPYCGDDCD